MRDCAAQGRAGYGTLSLADDSLMLLLLMSSSRAKWPSPRCIVHVAWCDYGVIGIPIDGLDFVVHFVKSY